MFGNVTKFINLYHTDKNNYNLNILKILENLPKDMIINKNEFIINNGKTIIDNLNILINNQDKMDSLVILANIINKINKDTNFDKDLVNLVIELYMNILISKDNIPVNLSIYQQNIQYGGDDNNACNTVASCIILGIFFSITIIGFITGEAQYGFINAYEIYKQNRK